MDEEFITGYIAFKEEKLWDNKKPLEMNYANLAVHFIENGIMNVNGGQLQSRFYQIKKKWDLFSHLRGLSMNTKTGLGWDEEGHHFTASEEHWASLEEISYSNLQPDILVVIFGPSRTFRIFKLCVV